MSADIARKRGPNTTYVAACDVCRTEYIAHQRGSHYCTKRCNMIAVQVLGRRVRPRRWMRSAAHAGGQS